MKKDFRKYKEEYYSIREVICPALKYEKVFVNSHGFKHLVRKGRIPRSKKEKKRRLILISYIRLTLEKGTLIEMREEYKGNTKINTFWCIEYFINQTRIRVIVRRMRTGKIHFFSIY